MARRYVLQAAEGAYTPADGSPYTTRLYRVRYAFNGADVACYMRLGLPDHVEGDVGFVILLVGGPSADVACDEPAPPDPSVLKFARGAPFHAAAAAVLTSGSPETLPDGGSIRDGEPMITMLFLGPGRGDPAACADTDGRGRTYAVLSDGDPAVDATPANSTGDDYYGPMSLFALRSCVRMALEVVGEHYRGRVNPVKIVATHSDGITLGSQLAAVDEEIVMLVDVEGPVDSTERTVSTECFDPFGAFSPGGGCAVGSLPPSLDFASWRECRRLSDTAAPSSPEYCGGHDFFHEAWNRFFRPPADVIEDTRAAFRAEKALGGDPWSAFPEPFEAENAPAFEVDWDYVLDGRLAHFWANREAITFLGRRLCPYVRAGCSRDHAQPDHYLGRHNTRALLAAARATTASPADVFWLKSTDVDPVRFSKEDVDPDTVSGLLTMPDCGHDNSPLGWSIEIDLVRWAFQAWQDGLFPSSGWPQCLATCGQEPCCGDLDAIAACVEACARATCGHNDACFEDRSAEWYAAALDRCP